jgi:predicted nucleic acid-binding protein
MAETELVVDTGLIVGVLHKHDQHHQWAKQQFAQVAPPLYTCEAVLSESIHLLEPVPTGPERLLTVMERDIVKVAFSYSSAQERVHNLLRRYADQPMSFADACLVAMTDALDDPRIVTTDEDFRRYRTLNGEVLNVQMPAQ